MTYVLVLRSVCPSLYFLFLPRVVLAFEFDLLCVSWLQVLLNFSYLFYRLLLKVHKERQVKVQKEERNQLATERPNNIF